MQASTWWTPQDFPNWKAWLKKRILLAFTMVIKTYDIQLPENLMYLGYIHSNIEPTTWKPNVLRVTFTQTWKITSMGKFSFYEQLSSSHWPTFTLTNEWANFYPQVQILHTCIGGANKCLVLIPNLFGMSHVM